MTFKWTSVISYQWLLINLEVFADFLRKIGEKSFLEHIRMAFLEVHAFFISNTFTRKARLKLTKKSSKCPETELWLHGNYSHSSSTLSSKKMKLKSKSHRYDLNRPRPRHGHEYKYKKCLSMMMLICITQHLNCIWRSINERKLNNWVENKRCL